MTKHTKLPTRTALLPHNSRTITALFLTYTEHPQMQNICNKTRPRWSRVLFDLSFYLTIWDYSQWRLLDELLTILDNDTLVVLIYLNTEDMICYIVTLFNKKSYIFSIKIPSLLRYVGCIPPAITTFWKLSLISLSDLSSCSCFSGVGIA